MELVELGALVFGVTEMLKSLVPAKYSAWGIPLLAVLIGAAANVYLKGYSPELVVEGLVLGLSATGLYAAVKH